MSKTNRIYKIFMTTMIVAIAGMLLAMGIIALQKSMKLNLSFNMNPNIFCRIDASIGDNTSYNTIFCNTPDNATIGAGWSGNGNTLTFTNSSTDMLKTVYLKIWNHTETRVMIETTNHTSVISAGTLATGTQGSEFSVSVPANGKANLDFSQVFAVDVSGVNHATITPQSNVYTIDGTYYVKSGATPTFAIESSEHYDELDDVTVSSTAEKSFLNGVLTLSNITGDVVVSASPIALTYTITYYKNAGDTTTVHTTQSVTYDDPYSIPTTEPTRVNYTFLGWATSSGATSATWEAGSTSTQTCSGNKDWYAVWQSKAYTINFELTSNGGYSPVSAGQFGILITNNQSLGFEFDSYRLFCVSNGTNVALYNVSVGATPVATAFNGDSYNYTETYYNGNSTGQTHKPSFTIQSGYCIYLFLHASQGGQVAANFTSYSQGGEVLASISYGAVVVKYVPTASMTIVATSISPMEAAGA